MDSIICWLSAISNWLESHNGAITAIGTIAIAAFTWRLWFSTKRLWEEAVKAGKTAEEAADAAQGTAKAVQALVTGNRARIFIEYISTSRVKRHHNPDNYMMEVKFRIKNYGFTPAVIDMIELDAYWIDGNEIYEPDPSIEEHKIFRQIDVDGFGDPPNTFLPIQNHVGGRIPSVTNWEHQTIIGSDHGSCNVTVNFTFRRHNIVETNRTDGRISGEIWFHCVVRYRDIYGVDRETGYYTEIGAVTWAPSKSLNDKYNYWK